MGQLSNEQFQAPQLGPAHALGGHIHLSCHALVFMAVHLEELQAAALETVVVYRSVSMHRLYNMLSQMATHQKNLLLHDHMFVYISHQQVSRNRCPYGRQVLDH